MDFRREKHGIPAKVAAIEYDPNRTARLALLYVDGEKRYIVAPMDVKVGDTIVSGPNAEIRPGNCLPISNIPVGTLIHNIEVKEGKGGQLVRSAGGAAQLLAKEGDFAQIACPPAKFVSSTRFVTRPLVRLVILITAISSLVKQAASVIRVFAQRSEVRERVPWIIPMAVVKVVSRSVCQALKSPWGKPTLGYKTRRNKKTDQYIVRRRSKTNR